MEHSSAANISRAGTFNGEMFRLARQLRGLTQKEFSEALHAEPSTVSRVENGVSQATAELADKAARLLDVPIEFFRQSERPYGLPMSVHPMWRSKVAVPQYSIDQALAELNLRIIHVRRLIRSVEYEPVLPMPEIDTGSVGGSAAEVAALVRRAWMMPAGPVMDLVQWIERAGCFVMYTDLPDAAMSGVTLRVPDMRPCIFVNRSMPTDRIRHTLAHELGHLIMHRYPSEDMEREADAFAASFLMPANDIRPYFAGKKIDLKLLAALKPEWRVSMQSLLYRSTTLGYVNDNQARYLWQQFNMKKLRMREPAELDLPPESPSLIAKLFQMHQESLSYSVDDLATLFAIHPTELKRLYGVGEHSGAKRPQLRVVG
ncbi:MAG: XRE family transcriptional regulator [Rubrivivax sp.]|nr:XRE family transcriptional regulator [Rubrivivax sp.]